MCRPLAFQVLANLFSEPQYLTKDKAEVEQDPDAGLTIVDHEEQNAGYQAAYSRLAASETAAVDPVAYVSDPRDVLGPHLVRLLQENPSIKTQLAADASVAPLLQALMAAGYTF